MLKSLMVVLGFAFVVAGKWPTGKGLAKPGPRRPGWCSSTSACHAVAGTRDQLLGPGGHRCQVDPELDCPGHRSTDTVGTEAANTALARQRANAARDALIANGVNAASVTVVGAGEAGLLVITPDQTKEARNRRVQVLVR